MSNSMRLRALSLLIENSEASKTSPAAAAQLAQDGHIDTPQKMARLIETGQASKTEIKLPAPKARKSILTGIRGGVTPLEFVLIKRDNPRVLMTCPRFLNH